MTLEPAYDLGGENWVGTVVTVTKPAGGGVCVCGGGGDEGNEWGVG